jgi:enolase-phosphatase E1
MRLVGFAEIRAILLDIEGTTMPLAYVSEVLFPFFRQHFPAHLERNMSPDECDALFGALRAQHAQEDADVVPPWNEENEASRKSSMMAYIEWLVDQNRKSTLLKDLQGQIWQRGYVSGQLTAPVFSDVPGALARWTGHGIRVGIFSSGSTLAQQLVFRHSIAGDLTQWVGFHFDTRTGPKTASESYERIAVACGYPAQTMLFISDVIAELDAAAKAGMNCLLSVRAGNHPVREDHRYPCVRSFDEL